MSLTNCYKCSKRISDTANIYPHCRAVKQRKCYECYKKIDSTLNYCSNCGASQTTFRGYFIRNSSYFEVIFFWIFGSFFINYWFVNEIVKYDYRAGIYLTAYQIENPMSMFWDFLPYTSIFVFIIILIILIIRYLRNLSKKNKRR